MAEETPPSASDALGNAGALPVINYKGKAYSVAYATPKAVQRVEQEVAAQAWANVQGLKGVAGYEEMKAETLKGIQSRQHAFAAPLYTAAIDGPDGWPLMLWGCVAERHPEVKLDDVRGMFRDAADDVDLALAVVGGGFFSIGAESLPAPEASRAALAVALTGVLTDFLARRKAASQ